VQNETTEHPEDRLLSPLGAEGGVKHTLPHVAGAFTIYAESPIERLLSTMESHAAQARASMDVYRRLAAAVGDPVVALLMRMVLADEERQGASFLRKLAHDERDIHGGLFSLLLETMAMDSEKHEHVLRFIQRRLQQEAESR
jgi:hypothetical protein